MPLAPVIPPMVLGIEEWKFCRHVVKAKCSIAKQKHMLMLVRPSEPCVVPTPSRFARRIWKMSSGRPPKCMRLYLRLPYILRHVHSVHHYIANFILLGGLVFFVGEGYRCISGKPQCPSDDVVHSLLDYDNKIAYIVKRGQSLLCWK